MDHRIVVGLFFLAYVVLGCAIVDDYGITYDEAIQRRHGIVAVEFIAEQVGYPHDKLVTDNLGFAPYGMAFQMLATPLEMVLDLEADPYQYYRLRHVAGFLLFGLALICFYRILRLRWPGRTWLPLLGTAILLVSPRTFAHAFFNPKDHVLLVAYVLAAYTLFAFLKKRSWGSLLLHAAATGLAVSTRPPGILLVVVTVGILTAEWLAGGAKDRVRPVRALVYVPLSLLLSVPFSPYLWRNTGERAASVVAEMANYTWGGEVLLFGQVYTADTVPWFYVPAWIGITTPLPYLVAIVVGIALATFATVRGFGDRRFWTKYGEKLDGLQLALSLGPVVAVIVLDSSLYNGWRHLHFIYPGLIYLAVVALARLQDRLPRVMPLLVLVSVGITGLTMVGLHPVQQVYFNSLAGEDLKLQRYDMDYWGGGFRRAFMQLADSIPEGETRSVHCLNWPCKDNLYALPPAAKRKLVLEPKWHLAQFIATNFEYPTEREAVGSGTEYFVDPYIELRPGGDLAIGIYRINQ